MNRNVIVHYHIYNNAGNVVDHALKMRFSERWRAFNMASPDALISGDELRDFVLNNAQLEALSSHQCRPPVPQSAALTIRPIFFIRHPIERIGDMYRFERHKKVDHAVPKVANNLSLPDYVAWRFGGPQARLVSNFQTLYLTNAQVASKNAWDLMAGPRHLSAAKALLRELEVFGLVDEFERSGELFNKWLAPAYPGGPVLDVSAQHLPQDTPSLNERLAQLKESLGAEMYQWICDQNTLDLALYEFAVREFARRIQAHRRKTAPVQELPAHDKSHVPAPSSLLSYREVRGLQKDNPAAFWSLDGGKAGERLLARDRLWEQAFLPHHTPKFKLSADNSFFAIGSCFARGLEAALRGQHLKVLSWSDKFLAFPHEGDKAQPLGFTNKYNTAAIMNELRWALESSTGFPEDAVLTAGKDLAFDPHVNPVFKLAGADATVERHRVLSDVMKSAATVDVLVITLGLDEAWFDVKTGYYLNAAPHPRAAAAEPDRFKFGRLGYEENLKCLEEIYRLVTTAGGPGKKIVLTVSPVPLEGTFTSQDVVVANSYSKSVLRAVAEEFVRRHENVDYFPSYEIVMNSDRVAAWAEDKRHVRGTMAQRIMAFFAEKYFESRDKAITLEGLQQYETIG